MLEYHRPASIEQALELLQRGAPLGGGTVLTPNRRGLQAVIDLSLLGLDRIERRDGRIELGAATRLQRLVEAELPDELQRICRMEAGWNIRNQATVAGAIVSADGRSPLATALLALGAELVIEPGGERISLEAYLKDRAPGRLITSVSLPEPAVLAYDKVARSPADRPQVCVAAARVEDKLRVALGGFGKRPLLIGADWQVGQQAIGQAAEAVGQAYAEANDVWASGEYRAAAAAALARRVVAKVVEAGR